jgi:hypothetical protein
MAVKNRFVQKGEAAVQPVDWRTAGIEKEHHRLFVLQWQELFRADSLDTWQVRTSNVLSILAEIAEVARVARLDHGPAAASLPVLLEEALSSIRYDLAVSQAFPFCEDALRTLLADVKANGPAGRKKPATEGTESPAEAPVRASLLEGIERRCRVLREQIGRNYRGEVIALLRTALNGDGKKKDDQRHLTMSLATDLAASGYSLQHLREVGEDLLRGASPFIERFELLVNLCAEEPKPFRVLFVVREWEGPPPTRNGAWLLRRDEARKQVADSPRAAEFFARATPSDHIICVEAAGLDPFSARNTAEALLTNDFAAIAFTSLRDPKLTLNGEALVIDPRAGLAVLTPPDRTRRGVIRRAHDWRERAGALLRMDEVLRPDDVNHLSAALQYYRLAATQSSDEVRLVNFWVAAETLARNTGAGSTISKVTMALTPLLAVQNVRRVARGLARRLTNAVSFKNLRPLGLLPGPKAKSVDPVALLQALRDKQKGDQLVTLLDHDPLLRFRLCRFVQSTLRSGKTAAEYLEANARNIEWQLGRIYRARNAIVHRGEPPTSTRQLLQHLETYVWTAIRHVTQEMSLAQGRWSLSDSVEHWRVLYEHALRVLRASEQAPIEALIEPSLFLRIPVPSCQPAPNAKSPKA